MKVGDYTKLRILDAGLLLWPDITVSAVAREAGLTHAGVLHHFENLYTLKDAIAEHAVKQDSQRVILQLIAINHAAVAHMSFDDRHRYLSSFHMSSNSVDPE